MDNRFPEGLIESSECNSESFLGLKYTCLYILPDSMIPLHGVQDQVASKVFERPFVCKCGKRFAQHNRNRYHTLHIGEKKFLCRGELKDVNQSTWGCRRRFARVDALGRHSRSPAGRVCIKPLLEEEAALEKVSASGSIIMVPAFESNMLVYKLPEALLLQYLTLGRIMDTPPVNRPEEMDGDILGDGSDMRILAITTTRSLVGQATRMNTAARGKNTNYTISVRGTKAHRKIDREAKRVDKPTEPPCTPKYSKRRQLKHQEWTPICIHWLWCKFISLYIAHLC